MSELLANGFMVAEAIVTVPLEGAWWADIVVAGEHASALASVGVTLRWEDGTELVGFGRRARDHVGSTYARIVAGAGGLKKEIDGKHYRAVSARIVAADIAAAAGEVIDDRSSLSMELSHWTRIRDVAGIQLRTLAAGVGLPWRVTLGGKILIGNLTPTDSKVKSTEVLDRDGIAGSCVVGRFLDAGVTILGEKVVRTITFLKPRSIRTVAYLADAA